MLGGFVDIYSIVCNSRITRECRHAANCFIVRFTAVRSNNDQFFDVHFISSYSRRSDDETDITCEDNLIIIRGHVII